MCENEVNLTFKLGNVADNDATNVRLVLKKVASEEINLPLFDRHGNSFYIKLLLSSDEAGLAVTLYTPQCLINYAAQNLQFYYNDW
jgi:hypothetical protein